jgi:hypothetical protein
MKHFVKEWRSDTKEYTCVCGYKTLDIKVMQPLEKVNCLDCLRTVVRQQSKDIFELKALGSKIANFMRRI